MNFSFKKIKNQNKKDRFCSTIGYGTFPWPFISYEYNYEKSARDALESIKNALDIGYQHIDTAFAYKNQDLLGLAIRSRKIERKSIYIASKLEQHNNYYEEVEIKIDQAIKDIHGQPFNEKNAYLDAFFIHYPGKGKPLKAWKAFLEQKDKMKVRHIGVSNFEIDHLISIKKQYGTFPEINQIEFHPWIYKEQVDLLHFCIDNKILVEGYSSLAQKKMMKHPILIEIAKRYRTTPARILLKWSMQHKVLPIFGSRNIEHLKSNIEPYYFHLSDDDLCRLNLLSENETIRVSKQWKWNSKNAKLGG